MTIILKHEKKKNKAILTENTGCEQWCQQQKSRVSPQFSKAANFIAC